MQKLETGCRCQSKLDSDEYLLRGLHPLHALGQGHAISATDVLKKRKTEWANVQLLRSQANWSRYSTLPPGPGQPALTPLGPGAGRLSLADGLPATVGAVPVAQQ